MKRITCWAVIGWLTFCVAALLATPVAWAQEPAEAAKPAEAAEEKAATDKPADEKPAEEKPAADEKPADEKPAADAKDGDDKPAETPAAETPAAEPKVADELAYQQGVVADKFDKLEKELFRLAELEGPTNPQRAALLKQATQLSKENFTLKEMNKVVLL
ncbi:MAG: hypothetical protein KDA71_21850, partial [Planctomycetales bacterium]|nr:hypothetical protein [Planctomycetales bacterium]